MFQGFSPETIDFLWGIRFNNNRDWFALHKQEYQSTLYEPMKALAQLVSADFDGEDGLRLHLSRIYRDMRMHPTTFYKDSLWMCFLGRSGPWLEQPSLCFEVRPEGYRYGFLLWAQARDMEQFRRILLERPEEFLKIVARAERESGIPFDGDRYARPKPCKDPRLERFFALKNLFALKDCPPDELLYSPALAEEVRRVLLAWLPVHEFFHIAE